MPNISTEERDVSSPVWDMSQERAFMENLTNQRFNFFLIVFGFVINGAINSKIIIFQKIILIFGTILCLMLALSIYRVHIKLKLILCALKKDNTHPVKIIDDELKSETESVKKLIPVKIRSVRKLIGWQIPLMCTFCLFVMTIYSFSNNTLTSVQNNKDKTCDSLTKMLDISNFNATNQKLYNEFIIDSLSKSIEQKKYIIDSLKKSSNIPGEHK